MELSGETPKQLSAARYCETWCNPVNAIVGRQTLRFLVSLRQRKVIYEIKLTANTCIALSSSRNAVSISSARTTKRFP